MSESLIILHLTLYGADNSLESVTHLVVKSIARRSIKGIEHIILYEYVVRTLILTQKIRAEFHDNTLRCHFLIKVMHLSWREK